MTDCPVPFSGYDRVVLAHGAGGRVMARLIRDVFQAAFANPWLDEAHDGAVFTPTGPLAVTTDGFTVRPMFFPGGDLGSLAVHGTVNDLAACGARPRHMTVAFLMEEGLPLADLQRIVTSMAAAARACGVTIVAGDTKVVERGKGDGLYLATTGFGEVVAPRPISPRAVRPGDAVLVSGPVGDHGVAVLLARGELGLESDLQSDAASVVPLSMALLEADPLEVHCLRDPTRGGLAAVTNEIAGAAGVGVRLIDGSVPVRGAVADACELIGIDPLNVACEGRLVAFVPEAAAEAALARWRSLPEGAGAARIGRVVAEHPGVVVLESPFGGERVLDLLAGEPLPRIC